MLRQFEQLWSIQQGLHCLVKRVICVKLSDKIAFILTGKKRIQSTTKPKIIMRAVPPDSCEERRLLLRHSW
jgi:hypothetical protein